MYRKLSLLTCGCLFTLALAACSTPQTANAPSNANAQPGSNTNAGAAKSPPANVVSASAPEVEIKAGATADAVVRVQIANGYHINGNPASQYQIATELKAELGSGLTADKPVYPAALTKKFSFSNQPIAVYEGDVVIKLPLRAESGAAKGARNIPAKLRVQACDDEVCYPPSTIDVSIPVRIN